MSTTGNWILKAAASLGGIAVGLGAFGAHGLEKLADADTLDIFKTAVRYQFYHVFALLAVGILANLYLQSSQQLKWAARLFIGGILIFSGSLYLLTLAKISDVDMNWLGAITPVGGLALIGGWMMLAWGVGRNS